MIHRHITTTEWTLMAIESLMDRGTRSDWREFALAIQSDPGIADRAIQVCRYREPDGAEQIVRALVRHYVRPAEPIPAEPIPGELHPSELRP